MQNKPTNPTDHGVDALQIFVMVIILLAALTHIALSEPATPNPTPTIKIITEDPDCPPEDFSDYCLCVDDCLEPAKEGQENVL